MKKSKAVIEKENYELAEKNKKLMHLAQTRLRDAAEASDQKDVAEARTKAAELYIIALCEMLGKNEITITREMLHQSMKSRAAIDIDNTNGAFSISIMHGDETREPSEAHKIADIAKHYGTYSQLEKAKEELRELIEAIDEYKADLKNRNDHITSSHHIAEEIADVEVITRQIKLLLGIGKEVETMRAYKIERQLFRMKHPKAEYQPKEV